MGNYIITKLILSKVEINMTHERIVWFSVTKLVPCPMTLYQDIVHVFRYGMASSWGLPNFFFSFAKEP